MKSLCDYCHEYGPIAKVLEAEQRFGELSKHLCADCFYQHKRKEEKYRQQRQQQRRK